MKITYIRHSSFSVELAETILLFDYYEGALPDFVQDKMLVVCSSHAHGDHFSPEIFKLAEGRDQIQYLLSSDISRDKVPEELLGKVQFVDAGEQLSLLEGKLQVETLRSTDQGVAFWMNCEGRIIYHAGDLNNWWWEGEDKNWLDTMAADYRQELAKLAGRTADIAFVPLDPRLGQWFYLGMAEFMEKVDAKTVFPMHFWRDYSIINKITEHSSSVNWRDRIVEIHREGEEFIR